MPRKVAIEKLLSAEFSMEILPGDIKFLGKDAVTNDRVYSIKSPLTNEWMPFRVTENACYGGMRLSWNAHIVTEYYFSMRRLLQVSRSIQPMNHDVTALCQEEAQLFGVKAPESPRKRRKYDTLGNFTSGVD